MPKIPTPLLKRDLLFKIQVQILLPLGHSLEGILPLQELEVDPDVWTDGQTVKGVKTALPVQIHSLSPPRDDTHFTRK